MEIENYIRSLPPFTKLYMGSCFAITFAFSFHIVDGYSLLLDFPNAFYRLQVLTLLTK